MGIILGSEFALVLGIVLWIILRSSILFRRLRRKRVQAFREIFINIFAFYLILIISLTLFPMSIIWEGVIREYHSNINLIPFLDILNYFQHTDFSFAFKAKFLAKNLLGNLLLLVPIGILIPTLWIRMRDFKKTVIIGASISLTIELMQFLLAYIGLGWGRATDIDDLILNTFGVMIGYAIYNKLFVSFSHRLSSMNDNMKHLE